MATGAKTVRRFPAAGDVEVPALLATETGRPVDPVIWADEERMKKELMAWAKAVASMALSVSSPPSMRTYGTKCTT